MPKEILIESQCSKALSHHSHSPVGSIPVLMAAGVLMSIKIQQIAHFAEDVIRYVEMPVALGDTYPLEIYKIWQANTVIY